MLRGGEPDHFPAEPADALGSGRRLRGGGDFEQGAHDFLDGGGGEGVGDDGAEDEAAVGGFDGDDFEDGAGADLDVDIAGRGAGAAGGEGEAAGEEVQPA